MRDPVLTEEGYWQAFFEGCPYGMVVWRATRAADGSVEDFEWVDANPQAVEVMGATRDGLLGQRLLERLPHYRELDLFATFVEVVETGEAAEIELLLPPPRRRPDEPKTASGMRLRPSPPATMK